MIDSDGKVYVQAFLGSCKGVGLQPRGTGDPHVCFVILTEDDGNWFASSNSTSSYWLPELITQMQAAQAWCENNCDKDGPWGWKFKEAPKKARKKKGT